MANTAQAAADATYAMRNTADHAALDTAHAHTHNAAEEPSPPPATSSPPRRPTSTGHREIRVFQQGAIVRYFALSEH
ncbi:hypothetical protein [Streptomyces sp. NPDC020742]|uniref:hypothetical protein n=1 Tax=Streptomyces sp. NPDC020742 TaxID=3154897 RepID=UPI0033D4D994